MYTVLLYTHPHNHTSAAISASRSLYCPRKWFCFLCSVHFIGYNFHSTFRLDIISFFPNSVFSVGSKQRATTTLDFEHVSSCSYFFIVILRSYQPLAAEHLSSHIWYQVILTLFVTLFLCVSNSNLRFNFCSVPNLPHLRQFVHSFALQWLPIPILLGTSAHQTFGLCQLFPNLLTWPLTIWPPLLLQQQLLRLNFVPTMRRNRTFGSASLRPSLQWQESNYKNSNMPMPSPACPSKSF